MPGPGIDLIGAEELAEVTRGHRERPPQPLRAGRRDVPGQGAQLRGGRRGTGRRAARAGAQLRARAGCSWRSRAWASGPATRSSCRASRTWPPSPRSCTRAPVPSSPRSTPPSTSILPTSRRASRRGRARSWPSTCSATRLASRPFARSPHGTGVSLIEDAAQAFGATVGGRWVGSFGTIGIYSFNEFKTITCGDGGMVVTDDEELYRRCFAMHDQGHRPLRRGIEVGARPMLGLNFRMTELEGAVLLAQLRKLDRIRVAPARQPRPRLVASSRTCRASASASCPIATATWPRTWCSTFPDAEVGPRRHGRAGFHHPRPLRVARLRSHGAPAGAAHRHGSGLSLRL